MPPLPTTRTTAPRQEVATIRHLVVLFERAALGDFTTSPPVTDVEEFTELYDSAQRMLRVMRDKVSALETVNRSQQQRVREGETLLTSIGEGMFAIDQVGKITMLNKAAEEMLLMDAQKIIGQPYMSTIRIRNERGEELSPHNRPIYQVLKTGQKMVVPNGLYCERSDGTTFPLAATASPIWHRHALAGAIIVFRDITREKEIDRAKSEFVALASHQLRTPLTMINWYTQRLLKGRAGKLLSKQAYYLREVHAGSRRMAELVQALLNVSRIELGTFVVDPKPLNIATVITNVTTELKPMILRKRMTIRIDCLPTLPLIEADPQLMQVVLENLVGNSLKYTPAGGIVSIGATTTKNNDALQITVADTGYGIPRKNIDQVFKKLFRGDNVKERDTDGTGLGLYIVKSIVDYSGGKIWFESEENKGTTFYVQLPLTKSSTHAPSVPPVL